MATATASFYTLSLHDALPISTVVRPFSHAQAFTQREQQFPLGRAPRRDRQRAGHAHRGGCRLRRAWPARWRSEEHTSELQSQSNLVCRLLLEKKKKK